MGRLRGDWSELSQEILASIARRLGTRDDVRHFQAVCKKWRSSTPQIPPNQPFLSPLFPHQLSTTPLALSESTDFHHSLVIVANTTFLLLPRQQQIPRLKPWLITVEELNPGKFILRKPLTTQTWSEDFPSALYLCDLNIREIHKSYNFRYVGEHPCLFRSDNNKVILFFNPTSVSPTVDDCYALVLHGKGNLLYVRLKDEDDYGYLHCGEVSCFDDIVNYRDSVWAIDSEGWVYVFHYSNELRPVVFCDDGVCHAYPGNSRLRLVDSSEGLYLIRRYHRDVCNGDNYIKFIVYKLDEEERKWNEVNSLNGRILFVSTDCCFFASAEDFPGCVGNCIFFPKDHFPNKKDSTYPDEFFFKSAREELEIGVFHLDDGETGLISNYLGYSDIFWPPPKWLAGHICSSRWNKKKQMDFGCQYSQEEERSPPILELAKEGQIVQNSSISSQQGAIESVKRMKGLDLSPGTAVEVNIDSDNSSHVWFPATFVKQVTNNYFLVEYQRSREAGLQKATVDSLHIRPSPPLVCIDAFDLSENVDVYCDFRWFSGVVTKIIPDKRYVVYFKHTKKEEEVRHADLRIRLEWTDGEWVIPSQEWILEWTDGEWVFPSQDTSVISDSGKQSGVALNNDSKQLEGGNQPSTPKEVEADCEKHPNKPKRGRPQKLPANDTVRKTIRSQGNLPKETVWAGEKELSKPSPLGRERIEKSTKQPEPLTEDNSKVRPAEVLNDGVDRDVETGGGVKLLGVHPDETSRVETTPPQHTQNALEKKDDNTPAKNVNDVPERPDEMPMQSAAIVSKYDQDLPFKKISFFWEMIESTEVLKRFPQKPHFRPLYDSKEECRERLAIESMASFINLVAEISRFQFGDPKSLLVGYLDDVVKFEELGFNVEPVTEKLNAMLSIIGGSEKADNTSKEVQSQIMERNHETSKIDEEIADLDKKIADHNKKIAELNEKRALAMSKKEGKDAEITLLQSAVDDAKGSLESALVELEKLTASCR